MAIVIIASNQFYVEKATYVNSISSTVKLYRDQFLADNHSHCHLTYWERIPEYIYHR